MNSNDDESNGLALAAIADGKQLFTPAFVTQLSAEQIRALSSRIANDLFN